MSAGVVRYPGSGEYAERKAALSRRDGEMFTQQPLTSDEQIRALGHDPAYIREVIQDSLRNDRYYLEHQEELWAEHGTKHLLIYSDGIVEAFEEFPELLERLDELPKRARHGAVRAGGNCEGVWIL